MQEASWGRGLIPVCWGKEDRVLRKPSDSAPTRKTGVGKYPIPGLCPHKVGHSMKLHCIVLSGGQKGFPGLPLFASPKYGFGKESPRIKRALSMGATPLTGKRS